ncbi:MAG TPA: DUF4215 domain-containing protein, partial [Myxococcota bacterium]|nr:DUF4215 domain-containing protein [Myxococcota bacterium]
MALPSPFRTAALAALAALPGSALAAPPVFTGDVTSDFVGADVWLFNDPGAIDVGVPIAFPVGTISGNDMADVRMVYDPIGDTLYVGINTYVIAGDVDGDGDPGATGAILGGLGGTDLPDFGGTESFAFYLDVDQDGVVDVIAGVPFGLDTNGFTTAGAGPGVLFTPSLSFLAPLPAHTGTLYASPSAGAPDLEFTIPNFSALPISGVDLSAHVAFGTFIGSFSDAGIGEDFYPGQGSLTEVPFERCGDGFVDGAEQCDDGNAVNNDACTNTCT